MDSTHPTAGWERVGDRFYRKTQLYTAVFDLDLDLDNFYVAGAPYGGAVGVLILGTPPLSFGIVWCIWILAYTASSFTFTESQVEVVACYALIKACVSDVI